MKIYLAYGPFSSSSIYFLHEDHVRKYAQKTGGEWKEIDVRESLPPFNTDINVYGELDENGKWHVQKETNQVLYQPKPVEFFSSNVDESGHGEHIHRHGYVSVNGGDEQQVQEKFDELAAKVERMIRARDRQESQ